MAYIILLPLMLFVVFPTFLTLAIVAGRPESKLGSALRDILLTLFGGATLYGAYGAIRGLVEFPESFILFVPIVLLLSYASFAALRVVVRDLIGILVEWNNAREID